MKAPTYKPAGYDTDLSDHEWAIIMPLIYPPDAGRGRGGWRSPERARACFDAQLYRLRTGCQWSMLPRDFPPKSTVFDAFKKWSAGGVWERANTALRERVRVEVLGREAEPSAAAADSQSVKGGQLPPGSCGYDAGKKVKGRKRHALCDTFGLLLGVLVTPASVQDRDAARTLMCMLCHLFPRLLRIFADGGYAGKLEDYARRVGALFGKGEGFGLEIVRRLAGQEGFVLLPRRWVIERTFGWLVRQRLLTRDHEKNPRHHEAFVYLTSVRLMARRLANKEIEVVPKQPKPKLSLREWIEARKIAA